LVFIVAPLILMLSLGQIYPLKISFEVKLKSFFYIQERESEFTQGFGCNLAFLSLMGIILAYWGESGNIGFGGSRG